MSISHQSLNLFYHNLVLVCFYRQLIHTIQISNLHSMFASHNRALDVSLYHAIYPIPRIFVLIPSRLSHNLLFMAMTSQTW